MAVSRKDVLTYLEQSNMVEISELISEIEEKFGDKIDLLIDDGIIQNNPSKIFMFEADEAKQIR